MRALLVDDEPHAREELRALVEETGAFEALATCANAIEALKALRSERPDVLFLDVQMPVVDGFELLGMLEQASLPLVVFVTAHDAFALRAFEERAVDYLLKPVSRERLARTVERLRGLHAARATAPAPALALPPLTRVPCLAGRAIKLVPVSEVESVRSSAAGVYVLTSQGEYFTELTLRALEERASTLVRCHKQHLVNVELVDELLPEELEGATVKTRSGRPVPVSRRFLPALRERLGI